VVRPILAVAALAAPGAAQRVPLEVRPRPGDTLRVTLEHAVTITGGPRNFPDSTTAMTTTYHIATRDVVERADIKHAFILAIVDSVRMRTTGSLGASPFPGVDRNMEGMHIRLQIARDGSSEIVEGMTLLDPDLRAVLSLMPAVLPTRVVTVGESWTRNLPIPADGNPSTASPGTVTTTFRLDSLTARGDLAWISLHGRVQFAPVGPQRGGGRVIQMSGSLSGLLLLDRRRGWLSESRATVIIESQVALPSGGNPLLVRVHVNQVMKTAPVRRQE
jgi:hypothetical protein